MLHWACRKQHCPSLPVLGEGAEEARTCTLTLRVKERQLGSPGSFLRHLAGAVPSLPVNPQVEGGACKDGWQTVLGWFHSYPSPNPPAQPVPILLRTPEQKRWGVHWASTQQAWVDGVTGGMLIMKPRSLPVGLHRPQPWGPNLPSAVMRGLGMSSGAPILL